MAKKYQTREKSLGEIGIHESVDWSAEQCRAFWDGIISANLELLRDSVTEAEDILDWVFSEQFLVACRYAGLDCDLLRDGVLDVVDPVEIVNARIKLNNETWSKKRTKQQSQLRNGEGVWQTISWGESLALF